MAITVTEFPSNSTTSRFYSVRINDNYAIQTIVTSNPYDCDSWISNIVSKRRIHYESRHLIIGLSYELAISPLPYYFAATLQLCSGNSCLIYQLCQTDITPILLKQFFVDPFITFVDLSRRTGSYIRLSDHVRLWLPYGRPINLREHVSGYGGRSLENVSVPTIAREVLGMNVHESDMRASSSNWEAVELSLDQIKHATLDAFVPFNIGVKYKVWDLNPNNHRRRF